MRGSIIVVKGKAPAVWPPVGAVTLFFESKKNAWRYQTADGTLYDFGGTLVAHALSNHTAATGSVDFGQQQALGLVLENLTSDPASPVEGHIWIRTDL